MKIHEYSQVRSLTLTRSFVQKVLSGINTPLSLAMWMIYESGDFAALSEVRVNPDFYFDIDILGLQRNCRDDYQAYNLFRKLDGLVPSDLLEGPTKAKYAKAEAACQRTNLEFSLYERQKISFPSEVGEVLYLAQQKIASILGRSRIWDNDGGFGPGATKSCKGYKAHLLYKLSSNPSCSTRLRPYLARYLSKCPTYVESIIAQPVEGPCSPYMQSFSDACKLIFVPKDIKSLRPISIEDTGSLFYQKLLGTWIRSCLRAEGMDLDTRQPVNGRLAREGSISGRFATIDFESASDTISKKLVEYLLPTYAYRQLNAARSTHVEYEGKSFCLSKFSSMGNGFTFELETLIFYSLLSACYAHKGVSYHTKDDALCNISVFGDDVICESSVVDLFTKVSRFCGFTINTEKSFSSGCFRESCGYDYFNGIAIKPFRVRKLITNDFVAINTANRLRVGTLAGKFSDNRFRPAWLVLIRQLHASSYTYGPFDSSSTSIWVSAADQAYTKILKSSKLKIATFRLLSHSVDYPGEFAIYVSCLYTGSERNLNTRADPTHVKKTQMCIDHLDLHMGAWLL